MFFSGRGMGKLCVLFFSKSHKGKPRFVGSPRGIIRNRGFLHGLWCILPRDVGTLTFCQRMGFPY